MKVPLTRRNLFERDKGHCRFCGKRIAFANYNIVMIKDSARYRLTLEQFVARKIYLPKSPVTAIPITWGNLIIAHLKCIKECVPTVLPIHVPIEERGW